MARQKVSDFSEMRTIRFGEESDADYGPGEEFTGYFKGGKVVNTKFGEKTVFTFQTEEGDVQIWASSKLKRKLAGVGIGNETYITYTGLGEKERGKNAPKLFNVEQDPTKRIHVEVPQNSFQDESSEDSEDLSSSEDADYVDAAPRAPAVAARRPATSGTSAADRAAKIAAIRAKA